MRCVAQDRVLVSYKKIDTQHLLFNFNMYFIMKKKVIDKATTTTTNKELQTLDTVRQVTAIPLQLSISITSPQNDNKQIAKMTIPFIPAFSSKGVKCKEEVIRNEKGVIQSVRTKEYGMNDGVMQFVPSDNGRMVMNETPRSEWAKSSAYIGIKSDSNNMLIQGLAENLRLIICSDNDKINAKVKGEELRDLILNFNPTKVKEVGEKGNNKDSVINTRDVLNELF